MKKSIPGIIVKNPKMVDEEGNPQKEAAILPHAIMIHPDMVDMLLEGMDGMFGLDDFKIMTTEEYRDFINETYPDKTKGTEGI